MKSVIQYKLGNLLDVREGIIVHGCNCRGEMGSGVAKAVRDTWPEAYEVYRSEYEARGLGLGGVISLGSPKLANGRPVLQYTLDRLSKDPSFPERLIVVNAMTQENYGRDPNVRYVDYDAVEMALSVVVNHVARESGLTSVHLPPIGCGLGNGKWDEIEARLHSILEARDRHHDRHGSGVKPLVVTVWALTEDQLPRPVTTTL